MVIRSLQNSQDRGAKLQVTYRLWKGHRKPKGRKGSGLDLKEKFRFQGYSNAVVEIFSEHYEVEKTQNHEDVLVEKVRIFLPYDTPEECFDPWYMQYDQKLGMLVKCDGETVVARRIQPPQGDAYIGACSDPCEKSIGRNYCSKCGMNGQFMFLIQELVANHSGVGSGGMMTISGMHDVEGVLNQLNAIYSKYGSLKHSPMPSPQTYGLIPYILTRVKTPFTRTGKDDNTGEEYKINSHYYALNIAEDPAFLANYLWYERRDQFNAIIQDPQTLQLPGAARMLGVSAEQLPELIASAKEIDLSHHIRIEAPPVELENPEIVDGELEPPDTTVPYDKAAHIREVWALCVGKGLTQEGVQVYITHCGKTESKELTETEINGLAEAIKDKEFIRGLNEEAISSGVVRKTSKAPPKTTAAKKNTAAKK